MVRRDIWAQDWPRSSGNRGKLAVKIIASSLRKGNIVELDGKLYVVLNAESFHPGKGTPTTQIDMRRISDGVKTQQDRKSTRLNSSHTVSSYAVFCLKKKRGA